MKINFSISEEKWNYILEKGYPEDGEMCIFIYKYANKYSYEFGGYCENKHEFYVNFGLGSMVCDAQNVIAWVPLWSKTSEFLCITD